MLPSAAPPNALFAEMLRAARELLAVRSPLDAELMVSELLGTWWGEHTPRNSPGDVEELVGEGLVSYAAQQRSPAALALLSGIACLGTPRQAMQAETAALALMEHGVVRPQWVEHVGAVTAGECYVNSDMFGDRDEVVCVYSYAGEEPHALVMVVDYNAGGMLRDGWVTSQVDRLLERCRAASAEDGGRPAAGYVQPGGSPAGPPAAGDGPGRYRVGSGTGAERLVRVLSRVHPGPDPHPATRPARSWCPQRVRPAGDRTRPGALEHGVMEHGARVGLGRGDRAPARLDPGSPHHAGGRVPGLG